MGLHRFAERFRIRIIVPPSDLLGEFAIPIVQHLKSKGGVCLACVLTDHRRLLGYYQLHITDWSHQRGKLSKHPRLEVYETKFH